MSSARGGFQEQKPTTGSLLKGVTMALKTAQETSLWHIWGGNFPIQLSMYTSCGIHHVFCAWEACERNWYLEYKMAAWLHSEHDTEKRRESFLISTFFNRNFTFRWVKVSIFHLILFFSWSETIRVDPTRTGDPSWSGPTFVPAFFIHVKTIPWEAVILFTLSVVDLFVYPDISWPSPPVQLHSTLFAYFYFQFLLICIFPLRALAGLIKRNERT